MGYSYPLVVGLNESEVDPSIFYNFHPITCVFCPAFSTLPPSEKVLGYSGLVVKTFSENSTTWQTPTQLSSTVPEFPFTIPILTISVVSLIVFYRIKIRN